LILPAGAVPTSGPAIKPDPQDATEELIPIDPKIQTLTIKSTDPDRMKGRSTEVPGNLIRYLAVRSEVKVRFLEFDYHSLLVIV
jgi:hypothetical protein